MSNSPSPGEAHPQPGSIGRQMAQGTWWTVISRMGVQGIGFLSTLILARLLVPADFGLVALANTFSAALLTISEFSLDVVLIQDRDAGREHYDTAWTLSVLRNLCLALLLALAAHRIGAFFEDPRVALITFWLAIATTIDGFQNIGIVDFRRALAFKKDMIYTVLGKFGSFLIGVPLAYLWRNYWALVAGIVAASVIRVLLSFIMSGYRPRFMLKRWRELMGFSKWLILNNFCGFLFMRSDTFVIGKIIGPQAVGIYGMAFEIANMTTSNLLAPMRRALFPAYAAVSSDQARLSAAFVDVFAFVMLIGTPLALGIGLIAGPLIHVMLGPQWVETVPLIQILSLYGFLNLVSAGSGPIFLSTGRPQYMMYVQGSSIFVMIPLLVLGTLHYGAVGAAAAVTVTTALAVLVDFQLVIRLLKLPVRRLLKASWRPVVAAAGMAPAVLAPQLFWPEPQSFSGWCGTLGLGVLTGALLYPALILLLWRLVGRPETAERHVLDWLGERLHWRPVARKAGWAR